jgi:hypothetical protein
LKWYFSARHWAEASPFICSMNADLRIPICIYFQHQKTARTAALLQREAFTKKVREKTAQNQWEALASAKAGSINSTDIRKLLSALAELPRKVKVFDEEIIVAANIYELSLKQLLQCGITVLPIQTEE